MIFIKKNNLSIMLFLIPLSYIAGIAVTEFFVILSILFFIFINKDKSFFLDSKIIFLFLFSFYIFLNAYFQIFDDLRLASLFHFRFVIFSLSIFFFCEIYENYKEKNFFLLFILSLLILLIDSIFQFFNGTNFLGFEIIGGRISSFFRDELILGSFLVRLLPIVLWFIFFLKIDTKKNTFYFVLFFSLYIISIYLSGGRTSFFLCIILIFSILCIIKSLRINGPRCPLCRGFNTSFNNNSSYYENTITITTPITYDNIVYDIAGNNITGYVNSFTYTNGFTNGTISSTPTTTISYNVISIE